MQWQFNNEKAHILPDMRFFIGGLISYWGVQALPVIPLSSPAQMKSMDKTKANAALTNRTFKDCVSPMSASSR